jgi:UDP-glucose:(heptosyl)LPS alpha-1,3-glucosyltransferase
MRIALLSREYDKVRGISRTVADLSERLIERGHQVTVFCADPPSRAACRSGIDFVRIPVPRHPYAMRVPLFARRASRAAARGGFDIVHGQHTDCHGADVITAHSCHRYAITFKRRFADFGDWVKKYFNPVHPLVFAVERFNFSPKGHRRIIAVSSRIKGEIVSTYRVDPDRITVIPNGVDVQAFHPQNRRIHRERVRRRHALGSAPLLLFVGYEFVWKGLFFLLEAVSLMRRRDVRVLVVGKPRNAHAAREVRRFGLEDRVIFAGPVADVATYYAASDAFVLPTRYEAFGLVIAEAMATGIPVLTTNAAGAAEYLEHGRNALLIDSPPRSEEIADLLDRLLDDDDLRMRLGRHGRRTAETDWDLATVAGQVLSVYRAVRETAS